MSYALASYGVVIAGVLAYAAWLARARRRLEHELAARPSQITVDSGAGRRV